MAKIYHSRIYRAKASGVQRGPPKPSDVLPHPRPHRIGYFSRASNYRDKCEISLPRKSIWTSGPEAFIGDWSHRHNLLAISHENWNSGPKQWNQVQTINLDVCAKRFWQATMIQSIPQFVAASAKPGCAKKGPSWKPSPSFTCLGLWAGQQNYQVTPRSASTCICLLAACYQKLSLWKSLWLYKNCMS